MFYNSKYISMFENYYKQKKNNKIIKDLSKQLN